MLPTFVDSSNISNESKACILYNSNLNSLSASTATESKSLYKPTWHSVATSLNVIEQQVQACSITNFRIVTPFNVEKWQLLLERHADQSLVISLIDGLKYGVNICYTGDRKLTFLSSNRANANTSHEFVSKQLHDDCSNKLRIGPFSSSPFETYKISPLLVVFKPHKDPSQPDKLRLVHNLSCPVCSNRNIRSVNDDITDLQCILSSVEAAIEIINKLTGCYN